MDILETLLAGEPVAHHVCLGNAEVVGQGADSGQNPLQVELPKRGAQHHEN